eukprot:bmy_19377T0
MLMRAVDKWDHELLPPGFKQGGVSKVWFNVGSPLILNSFNILVIMVSSSMFLAIISYETNNKYEIKNSLGQRIYFAAEDTVFSSMSHIDLLNFSVP